MRPLGSVLHNGFDMMKAFWLTALIVVGFALRGPASAQDPGADLQILSKDEARAIFSMTLDEWNRSALEASKSGPAIANGTPATGYNIAVPISDGFIRSISPKYDSNPTRPDTIVVTAGFRGPLAAEITDRVAADMIAKTRDNLAPDYSVEGAARRLQGAVNMVFTIGVQQ